VLAYARATSTDDGNYRCPICLEAFSTDDLEARRLTLDHVPPRSVGGRELCLTCVDCNTISGSSADYAIAEMTRLRRLNEALDGRGNSVVEATLEAGGLAVRGELRVEGGSFTINVHQRRNHPASSDALRKHFDTAVAGSETDRSYRLSTSFKYSKERLFAAYLRVGYLAGFSYFGYDLILDQRFDLVRRQIRSPTERIVPFAAANLDALRESEPVDPFVGRLVAPVLGTVVFMPAPISGAAVAMSVFLPSPASPPDFYAQIAAAYYARDPGRKIDARVEPLGWPRGPEFVGIDALLNRI
jgi:hypothetical protein